jgi:nucleoside-diphosphate-sugar epimerase
MTILVTGGAGYIGRTFMRSSKPASGRWSGTAPLVAALIAEHEVTFRRLDRRARLGLRSIRTLHPELPLATRAVFCRGADRIALHIAYQKNNWGNFIFGDLSA